jgi:hypothetical protein
MKGILSAAMQTLYDAAHRRRDDPKLSIVLDMQGTTCSKPINNQLLVHHGWLAGSYFEEDHILVFLVGRGSVKLDLNLG